MFLLFFSFSFSNSLFDCYLEEEKYKCKAKDSFVYKEVLPKNKLPPCPEGFNQIVIGHDNIKRLKAIENRFAALYAESENLKLRYKFNMLNGKINILESKIRKYYRLSESGQITSSQLKDYKKLSSLYKKSLRVYNQFVLKNNLIINKSLAIRNEYIDLINELVRDKKIYKCYRF